VHVVCPQRQRRAVFLHLVRVCLFLFLFITTTACDGGPTRPQGDSTPTPTDPASALDTLFTTTALQENFSGAVYIVQGKKVLLHKGYGQANWAMNVSNTTQTKFRIAGLSEQFNALAILLLQDQGKLHVQDAICDYISDCPDSWLAITIEQLLTGTSRITDYTTLPDYPDTKATPTTPDQLIDRVKDRPLAIKTNQTPTWSATDQVLLGVIIERVSGETYAQYLQHAIFDPLHLRNTGYDQDHPKLPEHATGYTQARIPADYVDMSVLYAAGGLYSTIDDLYAFDQALIQRKIGSRSTQDALFSEQYVLCKVETSCGGRFSELGMGYGWIVGKEIVGKAKNLTRPIFFDNGWSEGFSASNRYYPDQKLTVIWLSNIQNLPQDTDRLIENKLFPTAAS